VYAATSDPYCYKGTAVLKNRARLRDQAALVLFEHESVLQRADEPYPAGPLGVAHYKALHRHLFQDVYRWAGRFRTVRIAKGGSAFCYPENIGREMRRLFGGLRDGAGLIDLSPTEFSRQAAHFLAELNAIHPFREGNGRTQLAYLGLLADGARQTLAFDRLQPQAILQAMIASFGGNERPLAKVIRSLLPR
jgi:cell filamentation protein